VAILILFHLFPKGGGPLLSYLFSDILRGMKITLMPFCLVLSLLAVGCATRLPSSAQREVASPVDPALSEAETALLARITKDKDFVSARAFGLQYAGISFAKSQLAPDFPIIADEFTANRIRDYKKSPETVGRDPFKLLARLKQEIEAGRQGADDEMLGYLTDIYGFNTALYSIKVDSLVLANTGDLATRYGLTPDALKILFVKKGLRDAPYLKSLTALYLRNDLAQFYEIVEKSQAMNSLGFEFAGALSDERKRLLTETTREELLKAALPVVNALESDLIKVVR
jgi:hypothetical protein